MLYKSISPAINPSRAGYTIAYTPMMGSPGMGVPANTTKFTRMGAKPDAAFEKRVGNSLQYWTPRWAGFSGRLGWSVAEGTGPVTAGGPVVRPQIYGVALQYDVGGLSVRYGWERHEDYFAMSQLGGSAAGTLANPTSRANANKLVAIWRIGNTRLALAAEELRYKDSDSTAGAVTEYK